MTARGDRVRSARRPYRVVVAPDSFKGSLPAADVAAHLAAGLRRGGAEPLELPVADGGEGTTDALQAAGFDPVPLEATGPLGERRPTRYARREDTAVVELAAAAGIQLLRPTPGTALRATSRGVGEMVRHALDGGARTVVLAVGGSASTDGGAGMVRALGARLFGHGQELPEGGGSLPQLETVDLAGLDARLAQVHVLLASDVDNPLLGPEGAAAVYGPQKGADPAGVAVLEAGLARWVDRLAAAGVPAATAAAGRPGAGAAGGVGFAALSLLGARRRAGIEVVLELVRFEDHLADASLVVTGEGSLDGQSMHGKAPVGVARAAARHGVPTVAVCGRTSLTGPQLRAAGIRTAYALTTFEPDVQRCIEDPGPVLQAIGAQIAGDLAVIGA